MTIVELPKHCTEYGAWITLCGDSGEICRIWGFAEVELRNSWFITIMDRNKAVVGFLFADAIRRK